MQKKIDAQKSETSSGSVESTNKTSLGTGQYGNIFAPSNLEGQIDSKETGVKTPETPKN
jgi:hypothetical protein